MSSNITLPYPEGQEEMILESVKDYILDEVDGAYFGSATTVPLMQHTASDTYKILQSVLKSLVMVTSSLL